jgi:hypothetical protein
MRCELWVQQRQRLARKKKGGRGEGWVIVEEKRKYALKEKTGTLTKPVRRSRLRWRFLISPKSANWRTGQWERGETIYTQKAARNQVLERDRETLSWRSSSCASSCTPVTIMIHPSIAFMVRVTYSLCEGEEKARERDHTLLRSSDSWLCGRRNLLEAARITSIPLSGFQILQKKKKSVRCWIRTAAIFKSWPQPGIGNNPIRKESVSAFEREKCKK